MTAREIPIDAASLATFGETMVRLSPPAGERIETADELEFRAAGAESNVAVAAANLETSTTWLSKLPASPLGRKVVRDVRSHGVTPAVTWSEDDSHRQGAYYLEHGAPPRGTNVVYDRADAAVTTATVDELRVEAIEAAEVFFTSGITPALSATLEETTTELLTAAREADTTTAFDCNYRSKLWEPATAKECYESIFELVDLLFVPERDAKTVLELEGGAADIAAQLRDRYGCSLVIVTRGAEGALALGPDGVVEHPAYETETVDPIGTGDAFVGGFLSAWIANDSVADALGYGAATAALKRTIAGDTVAVTPAEVEAVLERKGGGISR